MPALSAAFYRFGPEVIASELRLAGLATSDDRNPSIRVRRAAAPEQADWRLVADGEMPQPRGLRIRRWRCAAGQGHRVRFDLRGDFADFVVDESGEDVLVDGSRSGAEADAELATLLEGSILGGAVRLRGNVCLHGNAIASGGRAILLIGPSGAGKSSLSWALVQQGCGLIADDMATVEEGVEGPCVRAGRARLRIWRDSADSLAVSEEISSALFPIAREVEKRVVGDVENVERESVPLHAVYLVAPRSNSLESPKFEPLRPDEALIALGRNLYGPFDPGPEARARELKRIALMVSSLPVRVLTLPDRLDALPKIAEELRERLFS